MSRCDFKIVLLGSEHVGKTSLVIRFVNSSFNAATPYQNTIGAAFCAKTMHSHGRDFNVGIWDTAGSERYEAMTRMYYRGAHAAVICYEPSSVESWTRLRHWLTELRTVEEECKVYLCGTKKDLLDSGAAKREVPEDIIATYSQGLRGHFLTSSKTGENVDELFQKIVDDCAADKQVMKTVEELRVQLLKDEAAYKAKNKQYYLTSYKSEIFRAIKNIKQYKWNGAFRDCKETYNNDSSNSSDNNNDSNDRNDNDSNDRNDNSNNDRNDSSNDSSDRNNVSSDRSNESSDQSNESSNRNSESSDRNNESSDRSNESSDRNSESSDGNSESSDSNKNSRDNNSADSDNLGASKGSGSGNSDCDDDASASDYRRRAASDIQVHNTDESTSNKSSEGSGRSVKNADGSSEKSYNFKNAENASSKKTSDATDARSLEESYQTSG